jgi:hypothetical protein
MLSAKIIEHSSIIHVLNDLALLLFHTVDSFTSNDSKPCFKVRNCTFLHNSKLFFHRLSRYCISKEDMIAKRFSVSINGWVTFWKEKCPCWAHGNAPISNIKLICDHQSFMLPFSNACAYPWSSNQHYTYITEICKYPLHWTLFKITQ